MNGPEAAADRRFDRAAGWTALVGVGLGALSGVLLLLATGDVIARVGILGLLEDQGLLLLDAGPEATGLLRWGYLADMLGYYLLWAPLMVALEPRLRSELGRQAARLATISGLLYVTLGSLGAVLLGTLTPDLIRTAAAGGADARTATLTFETLVDGVHRGVWQTLDALTGGLWILLAGEAFRRAGNRVLGWVGIVSGCFSFLMALGWFVEAPAIVLVGLIFLLPLLLWVAGAARELLREKRPR